MYSLDSTALLYLLVTAFIYSWTPTSRVEYERACKKATRLTETSKFNFTGNNPALDFEKAAYWRAEIFFRPAYTLLSLFLLVEVFHEFLLYDTPIFFSESLSASSQISSNRITKWKNAENWFSTA